jgi:MHS family proline/betaine transporter-like MFS transporter
MTGAQLRRSMLASAAGTMIEWFDFMLYAYLAPVMAPLFFPQADPRAALFQAYVVFAVGFLVRPLGGAVLGYCGDHIGRRWTLLISVILMSVPMGVTALLPTYQELGILAPLLLIGARLAMGFSVGGEFSGTVVALLEHATPKNRNVVVSLGNLSSGIGIILASATVGLMHVLTTPEQMARWGWRIPYALGGLLALSALGLRIFMRETPQYEEARRGGAVSASPLRDSLRHDRGQLLASLTSNGYLGVAFYFLIVSLPPLAQQRLGLSDEEVWLTATCVNVAITFLPVPFAWLADRFGGRLLFRASLVAVALSLAGLAQALSQRSTVFTLACGVLCVLSASALTARVFPLSAQAFPIERRCTGMSISLNLGVALGGMTPALATALFTTSQVPYLQGLFVLTGLITRACSRYFPE